MKRLVLTIVFLWFVIGGTAHFTHTGAVLTIVPPYVPFPRAVIYATGVIELLCAFALLSARTRPWAGWVLIILICAVTPANVYMWQHAELFPQFPEWLLGARLVLQVLLIACVWWCTRPDHAAHTR